MRKCFLRILCSMAASSKCFIPQSSGSPRSLYWVTSTPSPKGSWLRSFHISETLTLLRQQWLPTRTFEFRCNAVPLTTARLGLLPDTHANFEKGFCFTLKHESSSNYKGINYPIWGYSSSLNASSKG